MEWYYSKGGTQHGPVLQSELQAKLRVGEVTASDLVWKEGMADWIPAMQVEELKNAPVAVGAELPGTTAQVSPYTSPVVQGGERIPNYLWQSIVVTVLCCMPFGIPAIVFAAKVDGLQARGDIAGAWAASKNAKTWCWVAFGTGLVFGVLYILLMVAGGVASGL